MNLDEAILLVASTLPRDWAPHQPQAKQRAFMDLECQEALFGGAAGGGKSDALLLDALQYVNEPDFAGILFRRTHTDLALPGALLDRSHEWLAGTDAHWDGQHKRWTFPSGATLSFGYLDGPRDHFRYQSAEFQYIGFDELSQFAEAQYRYMFSRLRRVKGSRVPTKLRGATNPGAPWVSKRFSIPEVVNFTKVYEHQKRVFIPARREDNQYLDLEQYEEALQQLDPIEYAQLAEGRWISDLSGRVYRGLSSDNLVPRLPELPAGEEWTHFLSCDFGVTDHTAFVVLAFSQHESSVYVVESQQWQNLSPSEAAEIAIEWAERYGGFERIIGDTSGLGKAFETEWAKRFGLPMQAAEKPNKLGYIKLLNGDLHNKRLLIVEAPNVELYEHMRSLPWKNELHQAEHPGYPNHLPDATLYGWRESRHWMARARPKVPPYGSKEWGKQERDRMFERRLAAAKRRKHEDEIYGYD